MIYVISFLSLALAIASLMVMHERRQRRGLQSLLDRVLHQEFWRDELSDDEDATAHLGSPVRCDHRLRRQPTQPR